MSAAEVTAPGDLLTALDCGAARRPEVPALEALVASAIQSRDRGLLAAARRGLAALRRVRKARGQSVVRLDALLEQVRQARP